MKLRDGFITYTACGEQIMVAAGDAAQHFRGMIRSNQTAAFIIDCLKNDISRDELIGKLVEKYDAPRDVIARDVDHVLASLNKIGALE